jgi:hypothetical protein
MFNKMHVQHMSLPALLQSVLINVMNFYFAALTNSFSYFLQSVEIKFDKQQDR